MLILGINGGFRPGYQDTSAVLCSDGEILYAAEEERFNRIKHAPGQIPCQSIQWILKKSRISLHDIDLIASHGASFGRAFQERLKNYFLLYFKSCPPIFRVSHHLAHAASAYYASGYPDAMIVTVDNSGDGISTQTAVGRDGAIKILEQLKRPQSLGLFYSMITQFAGFKRDTDEYKLMGLSAYGKPTYKETLKKVLRIGKGFYELDESYLSGLKPGEAQPHKQEPVFSKKLAKILKLNPRSPYQPLNQNYRDLARSAQTLLEEALIELVSELHKKTGLRNLCLAGGVALNCLANEKLSRLDCIDNIYIQPASSDAGVSLGAAYLGGLKQNRRPKPLKHIYLGPSFSNREIFHTLNSLAVPFKESASPEEAAANKIAEGKVVGWFQGAMEFGPRALGARSILANPFVKDMKDSAEPENQIPGAFSTLWPLSFNGGKRKYTGHPLKGIALHDNHLPCPKESPRLSFIHNPQRRHHTAADCQPQSKPPVLENFKKIKGASGNRPF